MRISILQTALQWENAEANRQQLARKLAPLAGQTDLIVLPEMFTTGFSMRAEALAEPLEGPTLNWMRRQAAEAGAALTGSFICSEDGRYYNRLVWMLPDGQFSWYDKRHLFAMAGENRHYQAGNQQLLVEWMGFRIRPMICYDLRFPMWAFAADARNEAERADLLLYVANWPVRRALHWNTLLRARAIENQAFVAGVNIVGTDGNGHEYVGDSAVVSFSGEALCALNQTESSVTVALSKLALDEYRLRMPFLEDSDAFILRT